MKRILSLAWLFLMPAFLFAQKIYNVMDYGARGDGRNNDAAAIQLALDACNRGGGGRVLFPAQHNFLSGPLVLRSGVELHLEAGSRLLASPDESLYTQSAFGENRGEGMMWIYGEDIHDLSISGPGRIDGNGVSFMGNELDDSYELKPVRNQFDPRPHVLTLIGCRHIRIQNTQIGNAAYWTIHLAGCSDVVISGITLLNNMKIRNSDGIDIDHCKNVSISNCHIESGDDCICLKNRREYQAYGRCEDITVSNCSLSSRSCAIKIGSENVDTIRRVTFDNCIINNSNRGVGIQNRDEGVVEQVLFSNIVINCHLYSDTWWGKAEPIYVTAFHRAPANNKDANWRFPAGAKVGRVGPVHDIYFNNIKCNSENGLFVSAEDSYLINRIFFDQVDITLQKTTDWPGGLYDLRPRDGAGFVAGTTAGFYFDTAGQLSLRNCSVTWRGEMPPYYGPALYVRSVDSLSLQNLKGVSAFPGQVPAIDR